ncbi:hypothetical protein FRB97_001037 [Tulasnella sp. 331]|nr:hypothetical protein FRB97_001037 [Tulasnella sp. 331]
MSDSDASYHGMPGGGSHSSPARTTANNQYQHDNNGDGYESDPYQPPGQQHDNRDQGQHDNRGRGRGAMMQPQQQQQNAPRGIADLQARQTENQNMDHRPKQSARSASVVRGVLKNSPQVTQQQQSMQPMAQMQTGPSSGRPMRGPPGIAPPQGSELIKPSHTGRTIGVDEDIATGYRDFPSNRQRAQTMMGPAGHRQADLGHGVPNYQMPLGEPNQPIGFGDMQDDHRTMRRGSQDSGSDGRYPAHRSDGSDNFTIRGGGPGSHSRQRTRNSPESESDGRHQGNRLEASNVVPTRSGELDNHRRERSVAPEDDDEDSEDDFHEDGYPRRWRSRDDDSRVADSRGWKSRREKSGSHASMSSPSGLTSVATHLTPNGTHYIPASPPRINAYGDRPQRRRVQYINPHIQSQHPILPRRSSSLQVAVPSLSAHYPSMISSGGQRMPYGEGHIRTPGPYGIHSQQPPFRIPQPIQPIQYMQMQQAAGSSYGFGPSGGMFPGQIQPSFDGRMGIQPGYLGGRAPMAYAPGMF